MEIFVPADVPKKAHKQFIANYTAITRGTNRLFLFACDHKIEHLNSDFNPKIRSIDKAALHPEHLFSIAANGHVGALATHLGLIARYGTQHPTIPYIAKLNGCTYLASKKNDPISAPLWSVHDAMNLRNESNINICGVGVTVYLGSTYEHEMLSFAAQTIWDAHQHGLIATVWMYPRGKSVSNDLDPDLLAGAAGVAHALGADFVKIKSPKSATSLKTIVAAAGNTKVICSGGPNVSTKKFYKTVREQLTIGNTAGIAAGRNIFQHSLADATVITCALASMIYGSSHGGKHEKNKK